MMYYHKQLIWFVNSDQTGTQPPYKLRFEVLIDDAPISYPSTLWDSIYFVTYGYQRDEEEADLATIRDVYDGHPPGPEKLISTSYWVFDERIASHPTNANEKIKRITVKPSSKGQTTTDKNLLNSNLHCFCKFDQIQTKLRDKIWTNYSQESRLVLEIKYKSTLIYLEIKAMQQKVPIKAQ